MLIGSERIDLGLTLIDSAQCFRWTQKGDSFGAVVDRNAIWLTETPDGVNAEGGTHTFLRDYLDLNRDYVKIAREYAHIPIVRSAIETYPGLRVMNQPTWETLVSFILSANNNVSRIRKLCHALQTALGERFDTPRGPLYAMPDPCGLSRAVSDSNRAARCRRLSAGGAFRYGICGSARKAGRTAGRGRQGRRLRAAVWLPAFGSAAGRRVDGAVDCGLARRKRSKSRASRAPRKGNSRKKCRNCAAVSVPRGTNGRDFVGGVR